MDSSSPPPPSLSPLRSKLRPWYLIAAMMLTWFVGVQGMNEGFTVAAFLRSGTLPAGPAASSGALTMADLKQVAAIEQLRALLNHVHLMFPLSVAELILAGFLVVASGLAMSGRRGARSLALQAIAANALLAVGTFVLTSGVRAAYIAGVVHAVQSVDLQPEERAILSNPQFYHWVLGLKLVIWDLGTLALGVLALTRARTKVFFEAVARAAKSPDEP